MLAKIITSNVQTISRILVTKKTYWIWKIDIKLKPKNKYKTGISESQITTLSRIHESKIFQFPRIDIKLKPQKKLSKKVGNYTNTWSFEKLERKRIKTIHSFTFSLSLMLWILWSNSYLVLTYLLILPNLLFAYAKWKWSDRNFIKLKEGFCWLINRKLITHRLDIVPSQSEHCSLPNRTLFTHKLKIVHSQTEHYSLINWTLFTHKLKIIHSQTEHCPLISWILFTHKMNIVHS